MEQDILKRVTSGFSKTEFKLIKKLIKKIKKDKHFITINKIILKKDLEANSLVAKGIYIQMFNGKGKHGNNMKRFTIDMLIDNDLIEYTVEKDNNTKYEIGLTQSCIEMYHLKKEQIRLNNLHYYTLLITLAALIASTVFGILNLQRNSELQETNNTQETRINSIDHMI